MNDYFCVMPFYGYEYYHQGGTHCCLLPQNYDIKKLRQDILDGKRSDYCNACWKLEDNKLQSDRQLKNSAFDLYKDRDLRFVEQDVRSGDFSPTLIKIETSNKCNATCVTCGYWASTAWGSLAKKNKVIDVIMKINPDPNIVNSIDFKNLIGLNLVGGEPLYEETYFYYLEKLLETGNDKCFVSFTTNGSVTINNKNKTLLSKFKNLNIGVSIDGVGPVFEYMRYPLRWQDLLKNLEFFKTITDNISVNSCTSNVNVLYHHQTFDWVKSQNFTYHYNPVITPAYFRPSALPKSVKEQIFDKFGRTNDLTAFIGSHTDQDDLDFRAGLEELQKQDLMKKISYKDYLPEFYELIKSSLPS